MTKDQALKKLLDHHIKMLSCPIFPETTEKIKDLEYKEFQKEMKSRYWDGHAGFGTLGFYVDYRYHNNKVLIKVKDKEFFFTFNEFVSKLYDEVHCQQLMLF